MRVLPINVLPLMVIAAASLPIMVSEAFPSPLSVPENSANLLEGFGPELSRQPSLAVGELLKKYERNENGPYPEEMGSYFEGDIMLPVDEDEARNGIRNTSRLWLGGRVPYEIDFRFGITDYSRLRQAMSEFEKNTCIRFTRRTESDVDYVEITNVPTGCWSFVGRRGGRQQLNLQAPDCFFDRIGTAMHEMMHVLGYFHEQSRYDRDDFVTINWSNIEQSKSANFQKYPENITYTYGVPYDYSSITHYSAKAFSKNGQDTITPKQNGVSIGRRARLSSGDIAKLRNMYRCDENGNSPII